MGTHPIFESDFDCLTDMSRGVNDAKVYIGNLGSDPPSTSEVGKEFSYYGKLQSVWIARRPPGFAYVEFEDARDARDACKDLDGRTVFGRRIKVEISHGRKRESRRSRSPRRRSSRSPRRRSRSPRKSRSRSRGRRSRSRSEGRRARRSPSYGARDKSVEKRGSGSPKRRERSRSRSAGSAKSAASKSRSRSRS